MQEMQFLQIRDSALRAIGLFVPLEDAAILPMDDLAVGIKIKSVKSSTGSGAMVVAMAMLERCHSKEVALPE